MTASDYRRRRDPQPIGAGWEVAAAAVGGVLLGAGLAALAGLGLACAVWGGGWVWPHGTDTITHVLAGLLSGHPGQGLPVAQQRLVAGRGAVYGCVLLAELLLIALAIAVGVLIARYRRPGDARAGMASRSEARHALGRRCLRDAKVIIRPDLYGRTRGPADRRQTLTSPRHRGETVSVSTGHVWFRPQPRSPSTTTAQRTRLVPITPEHRHGTADSPWEHLS
jgi:hypothetical protein